MADLEQLFRLVPESGYALLSGFILVNVSLAVKVWSDIETALEKRQTRLKNKVEQLAKAATLENKLKDVALANAKLKKKLKQLEAKGEKSKNKKKKS